MDKVEFKDILGNALVIVNDTKDCKSLFKDLIFDFNKILIDTVFGFWGYDDMTKFNPHRVVVDMRNVSKETISVMKENFIFEVIYFLSLTSSRLLPEYSINGSFVCG